MHTCMHIDLKFLVEIWFAIEFSKKIYENVASKRKELEWTQAILSSFPSHNNLIMPRISGDKTKSQRNLVSVF